MMLQRLVLFELLIGASFYALCALFYFEICVVQGYIVQLTVRLIFNLYTAGGADLHRHCIVSPSAGANAPPPRKKGFNLFLPYINCEQRTAKIFVLCRFPGYYSSAESHI